MAVTAGVDYAWGKPPFDEFVKQGFTFAMRYISHDPAKDLTVAERDELWSRGIGVGLVFESTADRAKAGKAAGVADATYAAQRTRDLGVPNIPLYFAVDYDVPDDDPKDPNTSQFARAKLGPIADYFDGVNSVLGLGRIGGYGGYWAVKRLFDAGLISYGWQTYAWSGGQLDPRTHIQQWKNGVNIGGLSCDLNKAFQPQFGVLYGPRHEAAVLKSETGYWAWVQWRLGEQDWKGWGPANSAVRPNVPEHIPASWWPRLALFLAKRKL